MRTRRRLRNSLLVVGSMLLVGACTGDTDTPAPQGSSASSSNASPAAPAAGNGQLYTSTIGDGETTLRRYPIAADGSVGDPVEVLTAAGDDITYPGVVDSLGTTMLTGTYSDYWTTALQIRDLAGTESSNLTVDNWCGGEGLVFNLCALLDATHLARTTELGGETSTEGSVIVADLSNGSTVGQHGPFPGLSRMLGTTVANVVLLATTTEDADIEQPNVPPGTIVRLDTSSGASSELGDYPKDWNALCAVGDQGVIGQIMSDEPELIGVGATTIGDVKLDPDDNVVGCSADGAFLYIQNITTPTGEEGEEQLGLSSALERVTIATGARANVAVMPPGEWVGPVTR